MGASILWLLSIQQRAKHAKPCTFLSTNWRWKTASRIYK